MKTYSLRVSFNIEAQSDADAKRITEILVKELPRMDGVFKKEHSIFSFTNKKVIMSGND